MTILERKRLLAKIARLYYLEGLTQQTIANKLNISRTKVSRYLTKAKKDKIVEIQINYPPEDYSNMEYQIEKKYGISECIIVNNLENDEDTIRSMGNRLNNILLPDKVNRGYGKAYTKDKGYCRED